MNTIAAGAIPARAPLGMLIGRVLMAVIFLTAGFGKLTAFQGTAGYIASQGLPMPQVVAALTIVLELGGGLMLALGWKARWAAVALAGFTLLAGALFHAFWAAAPDQFQGQLIHFQKNLAMAGGLLYVALHGSGALSLDRGA